MWTPDPELEQSALATLQEALRTVEDDPRSARLALEAVGTLGAINRSGLALQQVPPVAREALGRQLSALETPEVDRAADDVLTYAPRCLSLDPSLVEEELRPLLDGLARRDRLELQRLGAELLDLGDRWNDEALASRLAFDELLEPELWQLLPLGERRTTELAWMEPRFRQRFWWRSRGADLPADALVNPDRHRAVLEAFPQAKDFVERAKKFTPPRPKRAPRKFKQGEVHVLAASGSQVLVSDEEVEVVLVGDEELVVIVREPLAPGATPWLEIAGQRYTGQASGLSQGRFEFSLDALPAGPLTLRLPLAAGPRTVELG